MRKDTPVDPTMPALAPTLDERTRGGGSSTVESRPRGPRIEDTGVIGRGGMGVIHRVFDQAIGRHAAMKVLDPEAALDPERARRFVTEARVTGQLEHPNIVPVYDFATDESGAPQHFTMKLVEGESLGQALARMPVAERTDADVWELLQAFLKVCDAVGFAHSLGVVHCDLKPDNIMLGRYGQAYVVDWGIARLLPRSRVRADRPDEWEGTGIAVGTAQYMAPEQAQGRVADIDERTDVFALGAILYTMLTGKPPYRGGSPAETLALARAGCVREPGEVAGDVPLSPALCRIAMRALDADPARRQPSAEVLKDEVAAALRGGLWFGTRTFPAGATILREGDEADAAYILTSGRCAVYRGAGAERRLLREMGPGEVFGEMALVTQRPRSATVIAVEDVSAVVITREMLARELEAGSWLGSLVRTLVDSIPRPRRARGDLVALSTSPV